jgi:hypothetical protein
LTAAPFRIAIIGHGLMGRTGMTFARDRRVFADGALVAARWLSGRTGMYTMEDVFAAENS